MNEIVYNYPSKSYKNNNIIIIMYIYIYIQIKYQKYYYYYYYYYLKLQLRADRTFSLSSGFRLEYIYIKKILVFFYFIFKLQA